MSNHYTPITPGGPLITKMGLPAISHDEKLLMEKLKVDLLDKLGRNPGDQALHREYQAWLGFVADQEKGRGLACQDCRLERH